MSLLQDEIDTNYTAFFTDWTTASQANWHLLGANSVFVESYRRLTALQALKIYVVAPNYSESSAAFFYEAHNDALVSHVNASTGAWRTALQALRSTIENTLCAIYYNDHPVEMELWKLGKFVISFSELMKYFDRHPGLTPVPTQLSGIDVLKGEYAFLSKAVHGSAVNVRMTDSAPDVLLWSADPVKAAMWSTRQKKTVEALCLLFVALHRSAIRGTGLTPLRNVLGFSIGVSARRILKSSLGVNIPTP